jgi:type II secretory pathway pseudopilin PulG
MESTVVRNSRARSFAIGASGALFVLIAAAMIIPQYADYTARSRASVALIDLRELQERIAARALAGQSLSGSGVGVLQNTPPSLRKVTVFSDGAIVAVASHFGQVIVLIPSYSAGKVSWQCIGGSSKDVPPLCRTQI